MGGPTVWQRTNAAVEELHPGYFALPMATGILSIGLRTQGPHWLSLAMLALAAGAFLVLLVLVCRRLVAFPAAVRGDLADPHRAFGFFTVVAGANVLGTRIALEGHEGVTAILLLASVPVWLLLSTLVPWSAALGRQRPATAMADGSWLIWVVATQSVAVAAATLEPALSSARRELALLAVLAWSFGVALYVVAGTLVLLRLLLHDVSPGHLGPPYWVTMGALAITVLAGTRIAGMTHGPTVDAVGGLVGGASLLCWVIATLLVPVLVATFWWRHVRRRVPLRYLPTWWSMVFPLGMYGVAGIELGRADGPALLALVGRIELWFALAVWAVVLVAMLRHLIRHLPSAG